MKVAKSKTKPGARMLTTSAGGRNTGGWEEPRKSLKEALRSGGEL